MTAIVRLMWKEYRVLRGFWLSLAIFGLGCDGLIFLLAADPRDRLPGLFGLVGMLPVCFALGAGATLFALEREESTHEFLRYLPLTSMRIFAGKVFVALAATLLLTLMLLGVALGGLPSAADDPTIARMTEPCALRGAFEAASIYAAVVLQAMGWSVFFSLRSARPLMAAVLGAIAAGACLFITSLGTFGGLDMAILFGFTSWRPPEPGLLYATIPLATAAVWLIDGRLGAAWLHGRRRTAAPLRQESTRWPTLKRLLWQEWCRSRRMLAVLVALGLLPPWAAWGDPLVGVGVIPAIGLIGLVLALLGACTFLGDQEGAQFRFFAERGVSARTVWRGRQLFWAGAAAALAMLLLIAHLLIMPVELLSIPQSFASAWTRPHYVLSWFAVDIGPPGSRWRVDWLAGVTGYFVWTSLAFGAGQFCSMFCRSGLVAAVFGVILAGVLLAWAALMQVLAIGWWWSVAPLAAGLFAATWFRSTGWLLQRRGLRALLPPVAMLVVPALALLLAVPAYRVWEVPEADLDNLEARTQPPPRPEAVQAVRLLLNACEQLRPRRGAGLQTLTDPGNDEAGPDETKWLQENREPLDAVVSALSLLPVDAAAEEMAPSAVVEWQSAAEAVIRYGQRAEGDGELDKAWTRYLAVLNLARLVRRRRGVLGDVLGDGMERAAVSQLSRWGASKGQTLQRLKAVASELRQRNSQDQQLVDVLWREYQENLQMIGEVLTKPQNIDPLGELVAKWAPWEFARARRLLKYATALNMREVANAEAAFAGGIRPRASPHKAELARAQIFSQTTILHSYISADWTEGWIEARRLTLCYRRGTQLALAAECWRLEHDELPEKLSDLSETFGPLPVQPFNNRPFEWLRWGLIQPIRLDNVALLPAGTPFIFSPQVSGASEDPQGTLDRLRRRSSDDPIHERRVRIGAGGMPAPAAAPGGMPMMGGPAPAGAAAPLPPDHPDLYEPPPYIEGLAFPIPIATSGERQPKESE